MLRRYLSFEATGWQKQTSPMDYDAPLEELHSLLSILKAQLKYATSMIYQVTRWQNVFKWAIRGLFLVYFRSFSNITNFTTNQCEKCPSSIWYWDLNPQSLEHESPPITTRPGLSEVAECCFSFKNQARYGKLDIYFTHYATVKHNSR